MEHISAIILPQIQRPLPKTHAKAGEDAEKRELSVAGRNIQPREEKCGGKNKTKTPNNRSCQGACDGEVTIYETWVHIPVKWNHGIIQHVHCGMYLQKKGTWNVKKIFTRPLLFQYYSQKPGEGLALGVLEPTKE